MSLVFVVPEVLSFWVTCVRVGKGGNICVQSHTGGRRLTAGRMASAFKFNTPPLCLPIGPSVHPSVCSPVHPSARPSIGPSVLPCAHHPSVEGDQAPPAQVAAVAMTAPRPRRRLEVVAHPLLMFCMHAISIRERSGGCDRWSFECSGSDGGVMVGV